jgi:hypothetical protein
MNSKPVVYGLSASLRQNRCPFNIYPEDLGLLIEYVPLKSISPFITIDSLDAIIAAAIRPFCASAETRLKILAKLPGPSRKSIFAVPLERRLKSFGDTRSLVKLDRCRWSLQQFQQRVAQAVKWRKSARSCAQRVPWEVSARRYPRITLATNNWAGYPALQPTRINIPRGTISDEPVPVVVAGIEADRVKLDEPAQCR